MRTKKKYYMPQWAIEKLEMIAKAYETTKTQALLMCIDKGGNYYEKVIKKGQAQQSSPAKAADQEQPNNNNTEQKTETGLTEGDKRLIEIAKVKWVDEN